MSRNRKRTNRHVGRHMAQAANHGQLGTPPARNRRQDRPPAPGRAPDYGGWHGQIAYVLLASSRQPVPRSLLRAAMPPIGSTDTRAGKSTGSRASEKLSDKLVAWERAGLVRRNPDDTVTVLDRDRLVELAGTDPQPQPEAEPEAESEPAPEPPRLVDRVRDVAPDCGYDPDRIATRLAVPAGHVRDAIRAIAARGRITTTTQNGDQT